MDGRYVEGELVGGEGRMIKKYQNMKQEWEQSPRQTPGSRLGKTSRRQVFQKSAESLSLFQLKH